MLKKILLTISALIIIIIIGLTVFIKIYITPERVKTFIVSAAEDALSRKVEIGEISISPFKGIEARDFSIKEIDGKTNFLKCKKFILKYQLMPLLARQVVIDELSLFSPEVRLVRDNEGTYNFQKIGMKKAAAEAEAEKEDDGSKALPISLLVNRIRFDNLKFTLTDLKKEIPDMKGTINLDTNIKSAGKSGLISKGTLDILLDELKAEKTVKDISVSFDYEIAIDLEKGSINIKKADVTVQDVRASLKGSITDYKTSPKADISISVPMVKAASLQDLISPFIDMPDMKLSGKIAADIKVSGLPNKPETIKTDGMLRLSNLGITMDEISATLDGDIKFDKTLLSIDLKGTSGRNTAQIKGTVNDYLGEQKINLDIYSKKLFLDELIPAGTKEKPSTSKSAKASAGLKEEAKPLDLKLSAKGEVKVDSADYKGLKMTNFYMKYGFKDNRLEIEKMTAEAGKGVLDLVSVIDMSRPGYTYNLSSNLDSLHADEVVNALFPKAKDTIFGLLSFNLKMNGAGTLPKSIKKNLVARGNFNIKNGRITNNPMTDKLALFLGVDELRTIDLNKAEGNVKIKNGVAKLESIFSSDDISMNPKGKIGLDETLNLKFDVSLSPELTNKALRNSSIANYIKDDEGWGQIPIKVAGTFSNPSYNIDIEKAGKRIIKKKARDLIEDILNIDRGKEKIPAEGEVEEEPGRQDIQKPLENLLKGIFN